MYLFNGVADMFNAIFAANCKDSGYECVPTEQCGASETMSMPCDDPNMVCCDKPEPGM